MTPKQPVTSESSLRVRPAGRARVALETTLLVHGVPRAIARPLAERLDRAVRETGAEPVIVGVYAGRPVVGLFPEEIEDLLEANASAPIPKLNTANLGIALHRGLHGATTVSTTMELASGAGVRVFATGGMGGVHKGRDRLDLSADLAAMARYPVAVVASGVKSLLDVASTREMLETLGVPVVGFQTESFPAFYTRETEVHVDARFNDTADLAEFCRREQMRSGRGVLICNPVPAAHAIGADEFSAWLAKAETEAEMASVVGRDLTPFLLGRLHELSDGRTLDANVALAESNAALAGRIAVELAGN